MKDEKSTSAETSADKEKIQPNQASDLEPSASPDMVEVKTKKMSKGKIIGLIIVLIIIWFLAVQFIVAERYDMQVQVKAEENVMGVNPLGDSLDFGDLSRDLGATRFVALNNNSDKDRYILVWKRGEIAQMIELNKNGFTLIPGQEEKLEFTIKIPPSAETRYYYGKAMVFKWPKFW